MSEDTTADVAVVGAGLAGLAAARALADAGARVTVFERGRGVGGRAAHRRRGDLAFDHGAQYFTVREPRFAAQVSAWTRAGVTAPWPGRIVDIGAAGAITDAPPRERHVGVPGMNAMAQDLAHALAVRLETAVSAARFDTGGWRLDAGDASHGPFPTLILAMPPEQAARLVALAPAAPPPPASLPCWCAMAAFDAPLPLDFDGASVDGGTLSWVARDSSKPGRPPGERWTLHAAPGWSAARLDADRDEVASALLRAFLAVTGLPARAPAYLAGHRWALARPEPASEVDCRFDPERALALCGDWCLGARVEGAFLSGLAAASRVLTAPGGGA